MPVRTPRPYRLEIGTLVLELMSLGFRPFYPLAQCPPGAITISLYLLQQGKLHLLISLDWTGKNTFQEWGIGQTMTVLGEPMANSSTTISPTPLSL
jgi:hypothetical protein